TNNTDVDSFLKNISIPRNFYLAGVLRWEAKESNDINEKYNKIKLAIHFDSLSIENFFSLFTLGLSTRRIDLIKEALSLPVLSDFRNQIFLLGNFVILLILAIFFTAVVFILIKLVHYLPVLSHKLDPLPHNVLKGTVGFALLLVPILVLRNFYIALVIYSVLLTLIFNSREKVWLRINLILIIVFSLLVSIFNFVPFLRGTDKTYYLYQMVALDGDIRINAETQKEKEVLAYALKKQGFYERAMELYEDFYYNQNMHRVDIINNLANIYTIYDEDERAEELYRKALFSDRGEPYFNLALLKLKKIEYLPAGMFMEEARKRGFVSASKDPIDIAPDTKDFYSLLMTKKLNSSGMVKIPSILILLIIFFITFVPFKIPLPYFCSVCGRPVCKVCAEEKEEEFYCRQCLNKLNATQNEEIETEMKESLTKYKRWSKKIISIILNILLPGAGLIYKNRNFLGLIISFFTVLVYIPILFRSYFIKPSGWICLSLEPILFSIGAIILLLCYIISFLTLLGGADAD
ncbi:MAG: hypothetical protein ABIL18_04115, partial [candidate division WOR-3 bacterium]